MLITSVPFSCATPLDLHVLYRFESLSKLPIRTNHGHANLPSKE